MSSYTIEAFLYDLANKHGALDRFKTEPDSLLNDYFLAPAEREQLKNWEVRAMHEQGVSPMLLLLAYQLVFGIERRNEYLVKMGMKESAATPSA